LRLLLPPSITDPPPGLFTTVGQSTDDPDPVPPVRSPDMMGSHQERPQRVPRSLQVTEHAPRILERQEATRVLSDEPSGSNRSNNTDELGPEPPFIG
jgi:hypothetical protein